jgi:hypothetical protein
MEMKTSILNRMKTGEVAGDYTWEDALIMARLMHIHLPSFAIPRAAYHPSLGVPQYMKATSPLRRYCDMVAHWQIEAALRYEDSTGTSLVTSEIDRPTTGILPFSQATVEAMISRLVDRERNMRAAERDSSSHWTAQFWHRALYHNEFEVPQVFRVRVLRSSFDRVSSGTMVNVKDLATSQLFFMLRDPEVHGETDGIRISDIWDCKMSGVGLGEDRVFLKPLRLVERINEPALQEHDRFVAQMTTALGSVPEMAP